MKKIILFLLLGAFAYVGFIYKFKPQVIVPYPYIITQKSWDNSSMAEKANVLIVGDRMGVRLDRYLPAITEKTSINLKKPLSIVNWAENHEGIHRTIAKLQSLSTPPQLIIYHGASEEFYEKRYLTSDKEIIDENFRLYNNDKILSLIMTFPILSKFIYKTLSYYRLGKKIREDKSKYRDPIKQKQMGMGYKFFQHELEDLIRYARENGSILALMTSPLNLDAPPHKICDNTISTTLLNEQKKIELLLKNGDAKSAYIKASSLIRNTLGNSKSYQLMGKTLKMLGRFSEARSYLENSTAFDCESWRSSVVFNNIIRKAAEKNDLTLIDFDDLVNKNYGDNVLFMDELHPQEIFYEQVSQVIEKTINNAIKI